MRFVDTNVLLYAASTADDEKDQALRARAILGAEDLGDGTDYRGVRVVNPFAGPAAD